MDREDYFFGVPDDHAADTIYAVVIYDIVNNRRRTRFARFLDGYGIRVQKSCYEVTLPRNVFNRMTAEIDAYCTDADTIRVYKVSGRSEVYKWGIDNSVSQEDVMVL